MKKMGKGNGDGGCGNILGVRVIMWSFIPKA